MLTHTHTQLSSSCGGLIHLARATHALTLLILAVSLLGLTSCGSLEKPEGTITSVSPPTDDYQNPKGRNTLDAWSDWGVYHNALCHIADDSLAVNFAYRYDNKDDYLDWIVNDIGHDYAVNVLGTNPIIYEDAADAYFETDEADRIYTDAELATALAAMVTNEDISQRESNFIQRGRNILNRCYNNYPFSQIQDSLNQWKTDINNINWGTNETTIVKYMSIDYYSFSFWLNEGFEHTDPDYDEGMLRTAPDVWERDTDAYNYAIDVLHFNPDRARNFATIASFCDWTGKLYDEFDQSK